ncbi:thermonuclease family protein [Gloeobacter morelensis]|uniref:Nuclease n=1 Tax=Gloeobacter morelensis MG652769 TaxID=2781736 RepID=A0ABY3PGB4_9CYAN|nr:nuclease [Gloeobacter morelensis]UFP92698.1 nuclease [Gloeobacter morelensis MG652769]
MPLTLIKGQYKVVGAAPDGDSIKFYPDNPDLWRRLPTRVRPNRSGGVQLRLDAVDTLETHYQPQVSGVGVQHQPFEYGRAAADELLQFLGFGEVTRGRDEVVSAAEPEAVRGSILTRFADKYGRSVAFAFAGDIDGEDGGEVFIDGELLRTSANHHLLAVGLAYPTFYSKLFPDLRTVLTEAAVGAREADKGLWPSDVTNAGFEVQSIATITEEAVILPKLFRRLLDYLELNDGDPSLAGFKTYLESRADEVTILSTGHFTHFDTVVEVEEQRLKLLVSPEDLVFREG